MADFIQLLRQNRNYRYTWMGQVVSEIGDNFNNIAVFSLVMKHGGSGLMVGGIMLSRAIPAVFAGPVAGVLLDRFDRKQIMIASDIVRAVIALAFIWPVYHPGNAALYGLSALLMFASPFFTSGRAAILPAIAAESELHTANSLTQTTQWATQVAGTILAGYSAEWFGFVPAFIINAASFLFSAAAIAMLHLPEGFRAKRAAGPKAVIRPWHEYREGLSCMTSIPLIFGIGMISVGWATGGGAAQILFTIFGDRVFGRGAHGIGGVWGFAGLGLLAGGTLGHMIGKRVTFAQYKRVVSVCYLVHGAAFILFSQAEHYAVALGLVALSRVGMAVSTVLNFSQLLRHTPDEFRGRVFSTLESLRWGVMIASMAAAGAATDAWGPRTIGVAAGTLSAVLTAGWWTWADLTGRLPEPGSNDGTKCDGK